jgi:hypothetical protein
MGVISSQDYDDMNSDRRDRRHSLPDGTHGNRDFSHQHLHVDDLVSFIQQSN